MKKLTLILDKKLFERLKQHCAGDPQAMQNFTAKAIESQLPQSDEAPESSLNVSGLEDYLKNGKPGSRGYGVKGQGW